MKKLLSSVMIFVLIGGLAFADGASDKYKHSGTCAAISAATESALARIFPELPPFYRILAAVSASMLVGLDKELVGEEIDTRDPVADFKRALTGVSFTIEW